MATGDGKRGLHAYPGTGYPGRNPTRYPGYPGSTTDSEDCAQNRSCRAVSCSPLYPGTFTGRKFLPWVHQRHI
eukprot:472285-Rhodomonas_salina.2